MAEDNYTEVTQTSWLSRIGDSIKGILFGLILFLVSFPLLFWNEGRAINRYKTLQEAAGIVVTAPSDRVDEANAGKLVHVTGRADTDEILTDPVFGVSVNGLKLSRIVEMYQWKETSKSEEKKELGGGETKKTTYSYSKTWSDKHINSSSFKRAAEHQNPGTMPFSSRKKIASNIKLGPYVLPISLVAKIQNFEFFPVAEDRLPELLKDKIVLHDASYYMGAKPSSPEIGDTRIKFEVAKPTEVSLIAKQVKNTFEPYKTKAGGSVELLQVGVHSADSMIKQEQDNNKLLTWLIRLFGLVLMFLGLRMVFRPLSVIADVLPILGDIVGIGTGIIAFLIATVLSLVTIAIAWFAYRPLFAIILIVIAIGLSVAIKGKFKTAKAAKAG